MASPSEQLREAIMNEIHEWPPGEFRYFIPYSTIENHVVRDSVLDILKHHLKDESDEDILHYTRLILSTSIKLFTIVLCAPNIKFPLLRELLKEGISDENLPLSRIETKPSSHNEYRLGKAGHHLCTKAAHEDCGIKSLLCLSKTGVKDLCGSQWPALAPVFKGVPDDIVHYDFEVGTILPYLEDWEGANLRAGGFGEVWKVRIHPAHQKLLCPSDPKGLLLAIKRLFPNGDYEKTFQLEVGMLKALNGYHHKHIVKLLATYKFKERYHLLFPLASGNLREHWDIIGMPFWNRSTYLWVLTQLKGLVSALNIIHNFETGLTSIKPDVPNAGTSYRSSFRGINLRVEGEEAKFGRHGDIKPENILWMKDSVDDPGSLMVADMGLGRFHRKESRSRVDPKTINGSPTYAPPEVTLNKPVSRAYDIWSLGCVFAEFITWLLKGPDGLAKFGTRRLELAEDGINDDTFFSIRTSGLERLPKIRPGVLNWIRELEHDERCSAVIKELLVVIEWHMLCVEPGNRISAKDLEKSIKSMICKATEDSTYLLGLKHSAADDRQGIKMPTGLSDEVNGSEVPVIEVNYPST
ncbi:hypothetical protein ACEPPN_016343 [Leptodophora sp. 'Broadleaf-Isolate-01']